jgi:hypothetical protein
VQISQNAQKIIAILCGLLLVGVVIAILANNNSAQTSTEFKAVADSSQKAEEQKPEEQKAEEPLPQAQEAPEKESQPDDFNFSAQPGDSFTALASDAVQDFATANSLTISEAQSTQAAALLAMNAGSPRLDIGQEVTIQQSDVAAALEANSVVVAQETDTQPEAPVATDVDENMDSDFSYTATTGDSYSLLVRQAIAEYAASAKLELTPSEMIAAETSVTAAAGFPEISYGQVVTISGASIKDAVEAAQLLTETQRAYWQPYADLAGL